MEFLALKSPMNIVKYALVLLISNILLSQPFLKLSNFSIDN